MDNPQEHLLEAAPPDMPDKSQLLAVMEQSERELAEGMNVPLSAILAELDEVAWKIETRRRGR